MKINPPYFPPFDSAFDGSFNDNKLMISTVGLISVGCTRNQITASQMPLSGSAFPESWILQIMTFFFGSREAMELAHFLGLRMVF